MLEIASARRARLAELGPRQRHVRQVATARRPRCPSAYLTHIRQSRVKTLNKMKVNKFVKNGEL